MSQIWKREENRNKIKTQLRCGKYICKTHETKCLPSPPTYPIFILDAPTFFQMAGQNTNPSGMKLEHAYFSPQIIV